MKSRIVLLLELGVVALVVSMLAGCFGDGGSQANYDGTWTVLYGNSAFTPPAAASGATVACFVPTTPATVTLVNGVGSTIQTDYCTGTAAPGGRTDFPYYISVAITPSTGAVSAVVNGGALAGQCISARGCAAKGTVQTLSLTR